MEYKTKQMFADVKDAVNKLGKNATVKEVSNFLASNGMRQGTRKDEAIGYMLETIKKSK